MSKGGMISSEQFTWDIGVQAGLPLLLQDGQASFIYGSGGMLLEEVQTADSSVNYYHQDRLGSVRALTNSAGSVVNTYEYDAYGQRTSTTGSTYNPFGYTGEYTNQESGLIYLRARYYDPSTQQFLTVDPLLASTEEAYAYVGGKPLSFTDPLGLAWDVGDRGNGLYRRADGYWIWPNGDWAECETCPKDYASVGMCTLHESVHNLQGCGTDWTRAIFGAATDSLFPISAIASTLIVTGAKASANGGTGGSGKTEATCTNLLGWRNPNTGKTAIIVIPTGSTNAGPVKTGRGFQFTGGSGGPGLDSKVAGVRIMDPTSRYPNGYVVYMNKGGHTVDPFTGQQIPPANPLSHILLP
jgi:RHS repeat-associated protein